MAMTTFIIGLAMNGLSDFKFAFINGFLAVMVAALPNGLPVTLTAQLIIVARRLANMGMFLKRVDIADNLGLTSVLLINKTGVLTSSQSRLTDLWFDRGIHGAEKVIATKTLNDILDVIALTNKAVLPDKIKDGGDQKRKVRSKLNLFINTPCLELNDGRLLPPKLHQKCSDSNKWEAN
jgi:P-type E1-E2 ATPase